MSLFKNLDWDEILNRLSGFATSEMARTHLSELAPLASATEAQRSFQQIEEMTTVLSGGTRPRMESLDLFSPWYQRLIKNAVLRPLELKDVRHFCIESLTLSEVLDSVIEINTKLKTQSSGYLQDLHARILSAEEPLSAIDQIMTADGDIRSDASEKLHQLNIEKASLAKQVQNILDRLVKDYQLEHMLQDRYVTTREGRWVLPVKSGLQHGFQGLVHAASQSKQTVFMEPQEVVPLNNRLREIEVEIEIEIERLLTDLSTYLSTLRFEFEETRKVLIEADVRFAQAALTLALEATACEFSENIQLKEIRHPLLMLNKTANKKIVTNTVELDTERHLLLLSGPNAGGKTVLLKSIGLAAQMARCGLPICAGAHSKLPFFNQIIVSIGDAQSVDANLSTFAAHLKKLDEAAQIKGSHALLLIDEICGSTDPEEGAALARGFIETYKENGVYGVITSHLGALKRGWEKDSGLINGSLDFDKNSGPTYRFIMGVPGQSLAIQTAKRAGVSEKIIERALENLSPELRKYQEAFVEVDRMKQEVLHLQDMLTNELQTAQKNKEKYEKLKSQFERERNTLLDKEIAEARKTIDSLIQESKVQDVFRRHDALQKIKYDMPRVIKKSEEASADDSAGLSTDGRTASGRMGSKSPHEIQTAEEFAKHYPSGTSVYIQSLGRDGVVQGSPNSKGEVPVVSSSMRLVLHWRDLDPSNVRHSSVTKNVLRKAGHLIQTAAESDRVADLRGLTSEDAISQLEIQLDTASLSGEDRLKVIHGHGTDTLKRAVRSYLSRSVYVKKWAAGTPESGGDGITWVELK